MALQHCPTLALAGLGTALQNAGCTRFHAKQLEALAFEGPEFDYAGSKVLGADGRLNKNSN